MWTRIFLNGAEEIPNKKGLLKYWFTFSEYVYRDNTWNLE